MGFMDKAKKLAEQAQTKLDEVQQQFNESGSSAPPQGPPVEYDQHGRPITPAQPAEPPPDAATPPHGDPLAAPPGAPPAPPEPAATPDPAAPPAGDPNRSDYTPPKLTHGDPLDG